jgi:hypothetical protein
MNGKEERKINGKEEGMWGEKEKGNADHSA